MPPMGGKYAVAPWAEHFSCMAPTGTCDAHEVAPDIHPSVRARSTHSECPRARAGGLGGRPAAHLPSQNRATRLLNLPDACSPNNDRQIAAHVRGRAVGNAPAPQKHRARARKSRAQPPQRSLRLQVCGLRARAGRAGCTQEAAPERPIHPSRQACSWR